MPVVELTAVSKAYGGVPALADVDFRFESGRIHAVLGENGAGKSTLMKLLAGVVRPTAGTMAIDGRPVSFSSPRQAKAERIVCMFQELSLVPDLTATENIVLAPSDGRFGFVRRRSRGRAAEMLARVGGERIRLDLPIRHLSLADKQLVEIAKALYCQPQLLILDEATSALTADQVERVFAVLRELRADGVGILFISHRLHEVDTIADTVSVFRNGRHVDTFPAGTRSRDEVVALMVGQRLTEFYPAREGPPPDKDAPPILAVDHLAWEPEIRDVTLSLRPGEILGVAGLDGQGQQHVLQALFGLFKGVRGSMKVDGRELPQSPHLAKRPWPGLALVPEDRKTEGLILPMSIEDNLGLAALDRQGSFLGGTSQEEARAREALNAFDLVYRSMEQPVGSLSGGNQQKVAIAKWLAIAPRVLLLMDPTRGIDVRTKAQIYRVLRRLAAGGMAIILQSTDHEEMVHLCDRVCVFYRGSVNATLEGDSLTSERLVAACLNLVEGATA
ncbi:MAG: sugar ABC transporter ATP-binding protein [Rhizobiales bacterium]|nr:sugar ABC transporter ATP-binding protein [Hyphomicrobiales bacterium]